MSDLSSISTEELMAMRANNAPPPVDLSKMSTEELMQMRAAPSSRVSVTEDMLRSIPGAVPRAAAGVIGLPQNLNAMANWAGSAITEKTGMPSGKSPIPAVRLISEMFGVVPNLGEMVGEGYDRISDLLTGKPVYKPQTGPGRVTDLTVQTLVGGPGTLGQKAAMGLSAGAAGEGARLITDNPIAIGVLQMLGAGAASLPWILRSVPAENIHAAIKDIKPDQLKLAQKLMDDAAARGVQLTGAEAIAQVTGKNSLQDIQRVVEASKHGGPTLQGVMNTRPGAVRQAFEQQADQITPPPASPSATPVRMQQAAEQSITKARQFGNAAAEPLYDAARTQRIPSHDWNTLAQNPATQKALKAVKGDPICGVTNELDGSVAWLDAAKRWMDDKLRTASPSEAKIWRSANSDLKAVADRASTDYRQARGIVSKNMTEVVDPMKASPVGDISKTGNLPAEQAMKAQGEILMPSAPRALDPVTIRTAIETLNKQDPTAARAFVRQNMQAIFDEATQNLSGGANQWGGAKFAAQVAGNPRQRDNLRALIEASSDKQAWVGFNRMLEVFEATGKRHAPGSQTAFNEKIVSELSRGGTKIGNVTEALGTISRWYDNFRFGKNTDQMAQILTDPRSVDLMRKLAKEAPDSAKASALVAQIFASQPALTSGEPSNTNPR